MERFDIPDIALDRRQVGVYPAGNFGSQPTITETDMEGKVLLHLKRFGSEHSTLFKFGART